MCVYAEIAVIKYKIHLYRVSLIVTMSISHWVFKKKHFPKKISSDQ